MDTSRAPLQTGKLVPIGAESREHAGHSRRLQGDVGA